MQRSRNLKDIYSLEAINTFFRKLYWLKNDKHDEYHILDELKDTVSLNFPFKEIAEKYKIIKNNAEGIIIPYNDNAREIIEKLRYCYFLDYLSQNWYKNNILS